MEVLQLNPGARAFSAALERLETRHDLAGYTGEHQNRVRERSMQHALPFFVDKSAWAET